jgi:ribosomal protein S18 acetylase RimI-like enzyme
VAAPRIRLGDLAAGDRGRLAAILTATGAFRADEVDVALELFDATFDAGRGTRDAGRESAARGETAPPPAVALPASHFPLPHQPAPTTSADYLFLGAFTPEDELVGYACYGPTPGTDRTFDLYWIAVEPAVQGAGIGTHLLIEVERRLQGQHARMLVIETSSRPEYAPTRRFYERHGYAVAARVREFYAPGDDRVILTKRFQSSPSGRGAQSP